MSCEESQVIEFLPWARRFARSCTSRLPGHLDHEGLQSAGVLGYLRAASRYDQSRGSSFRGFCAARIRGAVLDELRRWDWAPRSVHKHHKRIARVTSCLIERLEREPTPSELAEALGIEVEELTAYQNQAQPHQVISFDELTEGRTGEEGASMRERLADPQASMPDEALLNAESRGLLYACLQELPKAQCTIVVLHYLQNVPLREVADVLAVTPSRISQLHHQALVRLRKAWQRAETLG